MTTPQLTGWKRLAIALGIVLAGAALIPYIALPSERFGWQLFTGIYSDGPVLAVNYDQGAPGSSFTITGFNYPANAEIRIEVNGRRIGETTTDEIGSFMIHISTSSSTDEGYYVVEVEVKDAADANSSALSAIDVTAGVRFLVSADAPLRTAEGSAPTFALPEDLSAVDLIFLPFVTR